MEHSEEFDDAWRSLMRAFLWDWRPDERESGVILTELDLLTGDIEQDVEHAWEGCDDISRFTCWYRQQREVCAPFIQQAILMITGSSWKSCGIDFSILNSMHRGPN